VARRNVGIFWDALTEAFELLVTLNAYVYQVIALSLRVSGTAVLIGLVIGIPMGLVLGLTRFRGRSVLVAGVNTGLGLPPVVVGLFVMMMLSRKGPLGSLSLLYSPPAMIIAQVILATPYIAAITMTAVASLPREVRLQAMGLGASRLQSVWLVVKEARLGVMTAVIAGFGAVISEVGAVMMVGGNIAGTEGNKTRVLTTAIVQESRMGHFGTAMALGLILLALAFTAMLLLTRMQEGSRGRWIKS
jgi:tungstate transport system permease protein